MSVQQIIVQAIFKLQWHVRTAQACIRVDRALLGIGSVGADALERLAHFAPVEHEIRRAVLAASAGDFVGAIRIALRRLDSLRKKVSLIFFKNRYKSICSISYNFSKSDPSMIFLFYN